MSSSGTAGPGQLGITLPSPEAPYDMAYKVQEIRNAANQNALFQQTFQAKQRAGQIMAQAPDVQTGLKQLQSDPLTASMAPELMNSYRQLELTNQQVLGAQQEQQAHAFTSLTRALPSAYTDVTSFQKAMQTQLGTLPDATRQFLVDHHVVENMQRALFDDLPSDPTQAKQVYSQRLNALLLGAGFEPPQVQQLLGSNEQVTTPGGTVMGVRAPAAAGGGFTPTGEVVNPLGPTVSNVGGTPVVIGGGSAGGYRPLGPGVGNALGATPAPQAQISPTPQPSSKIPAAPGVSYGTPQTNPTGLPILSPAQIEEDKELSTNFGGAEKKAYDNAQTTMGNLQFVDNDLDSLAQGPSKWLTPGFAGKARTTLANLANTVAAITGNQPAVDPTKVASAENFIKSTRQLGLQVLTTMLGNQREAAQTINNITEAVPSIDNTFLGGKFLVGVIRAQSQRLIDERQFEQQYLAQNKTLIGAADAFNQARPPSSYVQGVLDQFGLTSKGTFSSPQAVLNLVKQGYLSHDQGVQILDKQFPGGPSKHMPQAAPPVPNALGATP